MAFALRGARVFDGESIHGGLAVVVEDARILDVVAVEKIPKSAEMRSLDGGLLVPGFIDVQVNGGGGALLNGNPT
ncbi:MAG: N-acetylglucosamine-6-phosphate deacetylase, partial [Aestuariivirga sp.]